MSPDTPNAISPAVDMTEKSRGKSEAEKIFASMREKISEVFPDDDREAWSWQSEDFSEHEIDRPDTDFSSWIESKYDGSDELSQRMVRRMFTIWKEMEQDGFTANDMELFEHQKALFAWIALSTVTGTRQEIANLLVRSPYGSGKSLVAGLVVRSFKESQEELLAEGEDAKEIPTGALLGLRKEHMLQNALGTQYSVLQPPYTFERSHVTVFWKNLTAMFGEDFSVHFDKPRGKNHPLHQFFGISDSDDDQELPPVSERVSALVDRMTPGQAESWGKLSGQRRKLILTTLESLADGKIVLIPDVYNVPRAEPAPPRQEDIDGDETRYRGDSAHALSESNGYRVMATHRHLALDPSTYTTKPNTENPAQFCIAYGSMLTRDPQLIRADVREEIMKRGVFMVIDEAGKFTPVSLGDSMSQASGRWPFMAGFTGYDAGIEGWSDRSPVLSTRKMVELGLMKPIGFSGIGHPHNPPKPGTEEAWQAYKESMFAEEKTAKTLGLPQPYECDTVVVAQPKHLREYAHRIKQEHDAKGIPVKIWCYDPDAGNSRWDIIVNGFNAPKGEDEPRRILVAPPSQIAEALTLKAECYDVLTNVNKYTADQIRGRLGHVRNLSGSEADRKKARTYLRMQWLQGPNREVYIREVAKMMGYELDEEDETWVPLSAAIDAKAHAADAKRKNLSDPVAIPDSAPVRKRKNRRRAKSEGTPLETTSDYVIEKEKKKAERAAARALKQHLATGGSREGFVPLGSAALTRATPSKQSPQRVVSTTHSPVARTAEPTSVEVLQVERTINPIGVPAESEFDEYGDRKPEKKKKKKKEPKKMEVRISVSMSSDGNVTNLEQLLAGFSINNSYLGSFRNRINGAQREGKRGQDLAEATLDALISLAETQARRSGWKAESGSRYIGVKYRG